jgi:hypothetical protein
MVKVPASPAEWQAGLSLEKPSRLRVLRGCLYAALASVIATSPHARANLATA